MVVAEAAPHSSDRSSIAITSGQRTAFRTRLHKAANVVQRLTSTPHSIPANALQRLDLLPCLHHPLEDFARQFGLRQI